MVKLTSSKSPGTGIRAQLGSLVRDMGVEALKSVSEVGKEVVKGVTMLPHDLVVNTLSSQPGEGGKQKDWADEWLKDEKKDQAPIADKEGAHTKLNTAEMMQKNDKAKEEAIKRQLMGALHGQYSRPSATSAYGQQQAQEYRQTHMSAFDKAKQEDSERKQQQAQAAAQQGNQLAGPAGKVKLRPGQKRQKTPMTGMENKAAKGHQ